MTPQRSPARLAMLLGIVVVLVFGLVAIWQQIPITPVAREEIKPTPPPVVQTEPTKPIPKDEKQLTCEKAGGKWIDCGSPCHGSPAGTVCIKMCEAQCLCGGSSAWTCPKDLDCQNKDEQGIGVCRVPVPVPIPVVQTMPLVRPAGMICDETNSICVNASYQNVLLSSPFTVTGTAIAFENQFAFRLEDPEENVLVESDRLTTDAKDAGTPGTFTLRSFILTAPTSTNATLKFFERSAKDGSMIHILSIPVRLPSARTTLRTVELMDMTRFETVSHRVVATRLPMEATVRLLTGEPMQSGEPGSVFSIVTLKSGVAIVVLVSRDDIVNLMIERSLKLFSTVKQVAFESKS